MIEVICQSISKWPFLSHFSSSVNYICSFEVVDSNSTVDYEDNFKDKVDDRDDNETNISSHGFFIHQSHHNVEASRNQIAWQEIPNEDLLELEAAVPHEEVVQAARVGHDHQDQQKKWNGYDHDTLSEPPAGETCHAPEHG